MNLSLSILVILNTLCGVLQIGILLFVQPLGYWLYLILVILGFFVGYTDRFRDLLKGDRSEITGAAFLFLINVAFFVFVGVVYFDPAADASSIMIILTTMMLVTISDFEEFGKYLRRYRNAS